MHAHIKIEYQQRFGDKFIEASAPGRINIIGEHTDYNDGYVLPAAIDRNVYCAIGQNKTGEIQAFAIDLNEEARIDPKDLNRQTGPDWIRYIAGVGRVMVNKGYTVRGFNIAFSSDIPIGAGLSSSAAIESAVAVALDELFSLDLAKEELARIGQQAEHDYVGVECGIMDQYSSLFGKPGHAILLDCRNLEKEYIPLDLKDYNLVLCDTGVKHALASSEYNTRRRECAEALNRIRDAHPGIKSLRETDGKILESASFMLGPHLLKRAAYVLEENQRVLQASNALKNADLFTLGDLMYESHKGLRWQYEVSCPELDFLVDQTLDLEYVIGSRMMGGGFGGCTLNLVDKNHLNDFVELLSKNYMDKFRMELKTYAVNVGEGAKILGK